jgi:3-hydroxymyristoyl/3-hydroxydecanoyl-(acyl carrier protein) dehydratase
MPVPPDSWLPLDRIQITPEGRWEGRAQFNPSSEWFSGHFEEYPLLPGVAILALAAETVKRQALERDRQVEILGFSRVRFFRLVFPEDELHISVADLPPGPETRVDFKIFCRDELVAKGVLKIKDVV